MSTLSVPLDTKQEEFVGQMVREGYADNKAQVVRKALKLLAHERLVQEVLEAEREIRAGKVFYGDLEKIAKKFRND